MELAGYCEVSGRDDGSARASLSAMLGIRTTADRGRLQLYVHRESWKPADRVSLDWQGNETPAGKPAGGNAPLHFGLSIQLDGSTLTCQRGPLGHIPFCYRLEAGVLYFASSVRLLLQLTPHLPVSRNDNEMAALLTGEAPDQRSTYFRELHRLESGGRLAASPGRLQLDWLPPDWRQPHPETTPERLRQAILDELARVPEPAGYMLSGGIDSTSLCALGKLSANGRLTGFHHCLDGNPEDTLHARAAARHMGLELLEDRPDSWDPLKWIDQELDLLAEPHCLCNSFMAREESLTARALGLAAVVDGEFGDNVFTHGQDLPAHLLRRGRLLAAWRTALGFKGLQPGATTRILKNLCIKPLLSPGAVERIARLKNLGRREAGHAPVRDEWLKGIGWREQLLDRNRRAHLRFGNSRRQRWAFDPFNSNVLEAHRICEAIDRIRWIFPFYTPRLVEFGLNIPVEDTIRDGHDRHTLRRAVEPYLPPEVAWRKGKGRVASALDLGLHGSPRLEGDWEDVKGVVDPCVDPKRMDAFIAAYRKDQSRKDGYVIWATIMLGKWLKRWETSARYRL